MATGADFQSSAAKSPVKERNEGDGADGRLAWQYERSANRQETQDVDFVG